MRVGWVMGLLAVAATATGFVRTETREPCAVTDPLRRPLFGDLHVHTALSLDASTQDTRNRPRGKIASAPGCRPGWMPPG